MSDGFSIFGNNHHANLQPIPGIPAIELDESGKLPWSYDKLTEQPKLDAFVPSQPHKTHWYDKIWDNIKRLWNFILNGPKSVYNEGNGDTQH